MSTLPLTDDELANGPFPLNIDITNIDKTIFKDFNKSIFIYLRNIELDTNKINVDFSKLTYIEKTDLLISYIESGINVEIKEISLTWVNIFQKFLGITNKTKAAFLSEDEQTQFINENVIKIHQYLTMLKSLVIWVADGCAKQSQMNKDEMWYQIVDSTTMIHQNIVQILTYLDDISNMVWDDRLNIILYNSMNDELFQSVFLKIKKCISFTFIYGSKTKAWNLFQKLNHIVKK